MRKRRTRPSHTVVLVRIPIRRIPSLYNMYRTPASIRPREKTTSYEIEDRRLAYEIEDVAWRTTNDVFARHAFCARRLTRH